MATLDKRFLYKAWLVLEDNEVIRCVCDLFYGDADIWWECYCIINNNKRFATNVISRDQAKESLAKPHKKCGFYGEEQ